MERIYFDISDIVNYALHHSRVSGIQRVQWNIITHLARRHGGDVIRCTFYDARSGSMRECGADEALVGDEFDSELMLIQLGLLEYRRYLPSRMRVKEYLRRYSNNKPLRMAREADVYLSSYLFPKRLARMGLARMARPQRPRPIVTQPLHSLRSNEPLVLLGLHWKLPQVLDFARRHKQVGGDVIQLVCDLIPYKYPQYANSGVAESFARWLIELTDCATRFICISECTARDLRQFLQGRVGRWEITAIPLAHEFRHFGRFTRTQPPNERIRAVLDAPYVLCVGTIEIRKNGSTLLRAWSRLKQDLGGRLPRLIFAGSKGWLMDEFTATLNADPSLALVIDLPTDEELACLYQNCLFTVYPSFYEGWGLPVGESAWFGKYCVAANTSSLPEVCGDLIDYADPDNLDDLVQKLRKALEDPDYVRSRARAIAAAPLRLWTEVAEDVRQFVLRLPHAASSLAATDRSSHLPDAMMPNDGSAPADAPRSAATPFLLLMPSFNQAHFIGDAVRSVLAQDDPDWELWILDNSTDNTPEVMRQFDDPRIHYHHIPERMDPGSCLNWMLQRARGKHFSYLHTDNNLDPGYVRHFRNALQGHELALAYCDKYMINARGRRVRLYQRGAFDLPRLLSIDTLGVPFAATTGTAARLGGFSVKDVADDVHFCVSAYGLGEYIYLPEPLIEYRQHGGSRTKAAGRTGMHRAFLTALPKAVQVLELRGLNPRAVMAHEISHRLAAFESLARQVLDTRLRSKVPARWLAELDGRWTALLRYTVIRQLLGRTRELRRLAHSASHALLPWAHVALDVPAGATPRFRIRSLDFRTVWAARQLQAKLGWTPLFDAPDIPQPRWLGWEHADGSEPLLDCSGSALFLSQNTRENKYVAAANLPDQYPIPH